MHQVRWSRLRHEWSRKATRRERAQLRRKLETMMALGLELQHFGQVTLRSVGGRRTVKFLQTPSILDGIRFTAKVAVKLNTVNDLVLEGLDSNQSIVNILEIHEAISGLLVWVHLQTVLLHNAINNFANLRENVVHVLFIDLVSDLYNNKNISSVGGRQRRHHRKLTLFAKKLTWICAHVFFSEWLWLAWLKRFNLSRNRV